MKSVDGRVYICISNLTSLSLHRSATSPTNGVSGLVLQDLVEKVVILRKAVERERRQHSLPASEALGSKIMEYSSLLASQGSLNTALRYLQESGGTQVSVM